MKLRIAHVLQAARDAGFTAACSVEMSALRFHPETLGLCRQNLCGEYGNN